ncbi:hypothetical protein L6164_029231 [Bauhinia variegata]|uniref:Uncharacterized protein n=1 Tax=Bauhinia variegata TaxID=167791 RepID=A0ACB9L8N4_BAUVA|nr:hypothetical protein L6164_029231 [Bauhinia variegata]
MRLIMGLACFSLLLLVLFLFKTSSAADGSAKFQSFKSGSMSNFSSAGAKQGFRPYQGKDGTSDEVLNDEKRKIYTGPNPLHNR